MVLDNTNHLWIGSIQAGLYRVDLDTDVIDHYKDELTVRDGSSQCTWILALICDAEIRIWVRLARSFVIYFPVADSFHVFPYRDDNENTFRYIREFAEDNRGTMWMANLDNGIGRTNDNELIKGIVAKIGEKQGLIGERIFDIDRGIDDKLWVVTDRGLSLINVLDNNIQNYPWGRGIPKTTTIIPIAVDAIAMTTNRAGINILNPQLLEIELAPPRLHLSMLRAGDKVVYKSGNKIEPPQLRLFSDRDYLTFEFSALGYSNPKEIAYRLEGVNDEWTYTDQTKSATYTNLRPRIYDFLIKTRVAGGQLSPERRTSIEIVPKFWESDCFRVALFWGIMFLAYLGYRWRLNDVRKTERLRAAHSQQMVEVEMQALCAQMNLHFLFNSLNSIQYFIIKNKAKEAVSYLNRFSRLVRLIIQNSRDKMISLKDELDALEL